MKIEKSEKGCKISVENMGEGIDEKHLPHISQNFYMQKNEQNKTGTGLGLSIASETARHNLKISATSVKNEKTVFFLETDF